MPTEAHQFGLVEDIALNGAGRPGSAYRARARLRARLGLDSRPPGGNPGLTTDNPKIAKPTTPHSQALLWLVDSRGRGHLPVRLDGNQPGRRGRVSQARGGRPRLAGVAVHARIFVGRGSGRTLRHSCRKHRGQPRPAASDTAWRARFRALFHRSEQAVQPVDIPRAVRRLRAGRLEPVRSNGHKSHSHQVVHQEARVGAGAGFGGNIAGRAYLAGDHDLHSGYLELESRLRRDGRIRSRGRRPRIVPHAPRAGRLRPPPRRRPHPPAPDQPDANARNSPRSQDGRR